MPWTVTRQAPLPMEVSSMLELEGCHSLLQGIFPTQELNAGLLHYRQFLYLRSRQRSPIYALLLLRRFSRVRLCATP